MRRMCSLKHVLQNKKDCFLKKMYWLVYNIFIKNIIINTGAVSKQRYFTSGTEGAS